jgi:hypothetical protein
VARQVFEHLVADAGTGVSANDLTDAFNACNGNIRETLFRLYDLHERCNHAAREANKHHLERVVELDESPILQRGTQLSSACDVSSIARRTRRNL